MADITEPKELAVAKLEERLMEMELSMKRMARKRIEIAYELTKLSENETATQKVIDDLKAQLG